MIRIKTNDLTEFSTLGSGISYGGQAEYDGVTVKDVLEEIKEYVKDKSAQYIGEGFGNPNAPQASCWGITINNEKYVGGWSGWINTYHHQYDNCKVKKVLIEGGWYCFYDFHIISELPTQAKDSNNASLFGSNK